MLRPHEFTVGAIADAQPLSLLLPRTRFEQPLFVVGTPPQRIAVFVGEQHAFDSMPCDGNQHWKGLIVSGVSIEVDETSVFDPETEYTPNGAVVREADRLALAVKTRSGHGFSEQVRVSLIAGLQATGERHRAGFYKWRIVIGDGDDKRLLHQVVVAPARTPEG